jgi:hypothetical protein
LPDAPLDDFTIFLSARELEVKKRTDTIAKARQLSLIPCVRSTSSGLTLL